ncbi:choline dehydrogenase [Chitinispirillum alkaliphilum]|nr:choline dehydrogenase [Chitinispirillum alkaliphilum]
MFRTAGNYDVCVIGSGAGGAPLAAYLAQKGYSVAVLEKGDEIAPEQVKKDELDTCHRPGFRPDRLRGNRELVYGSSPPMSANHLWSAVCGGGGTRVMSGFFLRMRKEDFTPSVLFPPPRGTDVKDWPLSLEELEPFYDRVERDIGISGDALTEPGRKKNYEFAPLKTHPSASIIDKGCNKLGYTTFTTPQAILSRKQGHRGECSYSGMCGSYACLTGAKGDVYETYLFEGRKNNNLTFLPQHFVYKLEADRVAIRAAHFFGPDGLPGKLKAKLFILACSSIETARLLLNSKSKDWPIGLANSSGQVGKNLHLHIPCEVTAFFDKGLFPSPANCESLFVGRTTQSLCDLSDSSIAYPRGGSVIFILPHPNPISRAIRLSYDHRGNRVVGESLKRVLKKYFSYNHIQTDTFIPFLSNDRTHVTISAKQRDYWGIPSARIEINPHVENLRASRVLAARLSKLFNVMGAEFVTYSESPFTSGELQHGTCSIGEDSADSVLDPQCRSHDLKNLYCTDGSFLPSGIPVPSTFTIMANSLRVAEFIHKTAL